MAERITLKQLYGKAERVSKHVGQVLAVEHLNAQGYRITNENESVILSDVMDARGVWNWLDAFEKGYDYRTEHYDASTSTLERCSECHQITIDGTGHLPQCIKKPINLHVSVM